MAFRGKPSRFCQRCRLRRLRCDLHKPSCGSCTRARVQCTGYRKSDVLRIQDETQSVLQRVVSKQHNRLKTAKALSPTPISLPLDLQVQARMLFFRFYIGDFSVTWDFLSPFFDPQSAPEYLSLSIDAVSLALLSHKTFSSSALARACQKYGAALRKTSVALQCVETAQNGTALDASLLLDLFEKITNPRVGLNGKGHAHVNGCFTLVQLRGLDEFRDPASLQALTRLSMHSCINCLSNNEPVPSQTLAIRDYAALYVDTTDPKWRFSNYTIELASLKYEMQNNWKVDNSNLMERFMALDRKIEEVEFDMPPHWMYERRYVLNVEKCDHILDNFYDVYPNRTLTQTWNVIRLTRIILCEEVLSRSGIECSPAYLSNLQRSESVIRRMIRDICASVPQMIDCNFAASHKVPFDDTGPRHSHTQSHYLDVYILLYGLYVAGWSNCCPLPTRGWIIRQLEHIADHFGIKQAADVGTALTKADHTGRVSPWEVYNLLGSYAFAA